MTRRNRVSASVPGAVAGPGGDLARGAAGALSDLSNRIGSMADRAAQEEGTREGARQGLQPEFRPRQDGTIRGRAYDEAGYRSVALRSNTALRTGLAEAFEAADGNPAAFEEAASALRAKYVEKAPELIRPDLEVDFVNARFGYDREFVRIADQAEADQLGAEAMLLLDGRVKDIGRTAFQAGLDESADRLLEAETSTLASDLLAYGPKTGFTFNGVEYGADDRRAGILSLEQVQETLIKSGSLIASNRVKGAFGRTAGLKGKQAFLQSFLEDYAAGEGVPGMMSLDEVEGLEREMAAEIRGLVAEQNAAQAELRSRVTEIRAGIREYRGFAKEGLVPPPEEIERLEAEALATGDATLVGEVREIRQLTSIAASAAQLSPIELQREVTAAREAVRGGASPEQAARIGVLESTLAGMRSGLAQDPYGYAVRAGIVDPVPLQPGDGLQLSLNARAAQARLIEQRYGVRGAMFSQDELATLSAADKAGGTETVQMAAGIVRAMGPQAGAVLDRMSERAPLLSHMGGLLMTGGSQGAVSAAAEGRRLMAEGGGVSKGLTETTSGLKAQQLLSGPLAQNPDARRSIEEAANAIYIGRKGLNAEWDTEAYGKALQEAAGAVFVNGEQFGGVASVGKGWFNSRATSEVVLPSWLKTRSADAVLDALDADDFVKAGDGRMPRYSDGTEVPVEALKEARLVTVGPGVYRLALGDPDGDDPRYLMRSEGEAYELNLDRVREAIARKVPEAVGP